ncbi:MAG: tRNA pseudouridine(38-40) synthase TruA [Streptococcaceae bacterium]|nr:tRNA pseudouridine(38-40) synthase TruA [Streptococcaceae bacterium]
MSRFKATVAYDGTGFAGFQRQMNAPRTVQGELEAVLTRFNGGEFVGVHGSGRTDAGVHALGQVVHFDLDDARAVERIRFALDTQTPDDISIRELLRVSDDFHARFDKHEKIYEYRLENSASRSPFERLTAAYFRYPLALSALTEGLSVLAGTHDFRGFMASGSSVENTIRTISEATVEHANDIFIFRFRGNGFLYKQVRNMVGTLIKIGAGKFPVSRIAEILATGNRALAGPTAAPEGLYLKEVIYTGGKFSPEDYKK